VAAIRTPSAAIDLSARPVHADGTPYPLEVVHGTWRIQADTPDEILGLLMDGYADLPDERARLQSRIRLAVEAQATVQALLNAGEQFDYSTAEEIQVLLHSRDAQPTIEEWQCAIPLVLITSFYQPIGDRPRPRATAPGQIWWLDPSTAQSLLETLHGVRWLDVNLVGTPEGWATGNETYPTPDASGAAGYRWRRVRTGNP
jgi:hypothetical protein